MDKQQAETAAETLLAPHRALQGKVHEGQQLKQAKRQAQRKRGAWALAGFVLGAGLGFVMMGSILPGALIGLLVGAGAGILLLKNA